MYGKQLLHVRYCWKLLSAVNRCMQGCCQEMHL
jgi:hypothetical protein